jgi:hypothetical protein
MQLRTFLVPAALFVLSAMQAQNLEIVHDSVAAPPDPGRYTHNIYISLGIGHSSLGFKTGYRNMHQLLKDQNINFLKDNSQYTIGFGGRIQRWHINFQLAYSILFLGEATTNPARYLHAESEYFNAGINVGYAFWQSRNSLWIVRGGVGASEYFLRVTEIAPTGSFDFDNVAGNPPLRLWPAFSHISGVGNICIEWQPGGRAKRGVSLAPGLMLGYQFGLGQPQWKLSDVPTFNAPTDRAGFAYFGVDLKLGRNFERKLKN